MARAASESQFDEQTRSRSIPHQPIDVVGALADVEGALEIGVALGVLLDGWNAQMLDEVSRLVRMIVRAKRETRC